ncbi:HD domain-containing protein [Wukongibacter baidiensis]|uniref:HD domain-containing protein n=1 Tax=Wukongibacter baidiensis TaxID=1723361 RepID=UPI003D7F461E
MTAKDIVRKVEGIVEDACKRESNAFGYGIWSHHIVYVVKYSKKLAEKIGADEEIVELASLLHDYASIKDFKCYKDHHIYGGQEAEKILKDLDYPTNRIEKIKGCILSHRASIDSDRLSKEEVCVASGDAMAHIDQVVSLLYYVYKEKNMDIDEGKEWVRNKVMRSWNKLNKEGKELIEEKYYSVLKILE